MADATNGKPASANAWSARHAELCRRMALRRRGIVAFVGDQIGPAAHYRLVDDRGAMLVNRGHPLLRDRRHAPTGRARDRGAPALYERVAAGLSASADLADGEARKAESGGHAGDPALAERARHAAERGRCSARRLRLRAQTERLFGDPPRWRALFDGHDTLDGLPLRRVDEAVIATDLAGTVKLWNAAAERLYGWRCAEVVGRPITEITVGPDDTEVAERIMASVRWIGSWEGEFWVTRHDGSRFLAYVRVVVVADDDGGPLGLVGISIDLAPGLSDPAATARTAPVSARPRVRRHRDAAVRSTPGGEPAAAATAETASLGSRASGGSHRH